MDKRDAGKPGSFKLAKDWDIPYKQTEDFIKGSRYRLAEIPIGQKEFHSSLEKLREEMLLLDDPNYASVVGWYISRKCREDETMSSQVLKPHKSLQRCMDYIMEKAFSLATEEAKKKGFDRVPENAGLTLTEKTVFPWAEEYYQKDDEAEIQKKEEKAKQEIRSAWERAERNSAPTSKTPSKKKGTQKKAPGKARETSGSEKGTKKKSSFGQMSLFDMTQGCAEQEDA